MAVLRVPTSKGWSCFYGKSRCRGESSDLHTQQLQPQGPCMSVTVTDTPQSIAGEVGIPELSTATQPGDVMHSCSLSHGILIPPLH